MTLKMWSKNQVNIFVATLTIFVSLSHFAKNEVQVKVVGKNQVEKLAQANNEFSFKLLKILENDKNIFFSPFSIHTALAMLNEGSRGVTSREIQHVLGYDVAGVNNSDVASNFRELLNIVQNFGEEYQLEVANALLTQSDYPIFAEYISKIKEQFHGFVKNIDFEIDNEAAIREINNWVNERTHGKITSLLKRLEGDAKAVILNAVYFKGFWEYPFDENRTEDLIFYNNGINPVNTPIMRREILKCMYTRNTEEGFHAISLPYIGNDIEMVIILPLQKYTLKDIQLSAEKLEQILSEMDKLSVIIKLPKFKLQYSQELKEDLMNLGMKQAFSNANLSGINQDRRLFVSRVLHKAVIEVNERGSIAAGSTAVIIIPRSGSIKFICDRPFLFIIRDRRTKMNLFMGEINQL